ncbi:MAG: bifunctional demethylmenaquinone methyltransferase/2-methoxy-6-polyprenyl-1,4-benzoquinol methylase UbiE [Desulfamplus sp.]|nr:bifunctional demethylmenaquinone methyltransferase/2-methoxy-6-polyprenyl-1,4-benzoquinol methylase UbiE [Desulfamplus sp.]MBF0258360.1 bifunctional demethylmenaquinone methyltransferase/2-methoxy-6-polyprenyl-1,4-benzoquinol methylase UbiE [Desulfamplus sp.]
MSIELDFIKEMFDSIAPKYDFLNRFLSAGQDILWRKEMVLGAELPNQSIVLDVACGTCDVALEVKKQQGDGATVFATDFSPGMLALGKRKILKHEEGATIHLVSGNALALPFKESRFDAVFIAFGIRNIMDRQSAVASFYRVLKPGGTLAVLELTSPPKGFFRDIYLLYFKRLLPAIGTVLSKNAGAYHYLPESVLNFPNPREFASTLRQSGFEMVKWKVMTLGIVTLFIGKKASAL